MLLNACGAEYGIRDGESGSEQRRQQRKEGEPGGSQGDGGPRSPAGAPGGAPHPAADGDEEGELDDGDGPQERGADSLGAMEELQKHQVLGDVGGSAGPDGLGEQQARRRRCRGWRKVPRGETEHERVAESEEAIGQQRALCPGRHPLQSVAQTEFGAGQRQREKLSERDAGEEDPGAQRGSESKRGKQQSICGQFP